MADANNKYEREIALEDGLLLSMVQQKGEMVEKGRAIARQMTELQTKIEQLSKEMEPLTQRVVKIKVEIFKRLQKLAGKQLSEFEIPITTDLRDGKIVLRVSDSLAEFKDTFKTFDKFGEPVPVNALRAKQ